MIINSHKLVVVQVFVVTQPWSGPIVFF